jgi:hypothetical protein
MSSRAETERRIIIESSSPIARHSINQFRLKLSFDSETKVSTVSRKALMAERRKQNTRLGYLYGNHKIEDVLHRVLWSMQEDEAADWNITKTEIKFLKQAGLPTSYINSLKRPRSAA